MREGDLGLCCWIELSLDVPIIMPLLIFPNRLFPAALELGLEDPPGEDNLDALKGVVDVPNVALY